MDTLTLIIIVLIVLLIGCVLIGFILRRKQSSFDCDKTISEEASVNMDESVDEGKESVINKQILSLNEDLSAKLATIESLQKKESLLQSKIEEKNKEILSLESKLQHVVESSSDSTDKQVVLLKNELLTKTKELNDAQDEIDDLEDEISSIKKKLSKLKFEYDETNENLSKITKKLNSVQKDFQDALSELEDLKEENVSKDEAINFVNAILNAKDADDRDAIDVAVKVQKIEDIVNDQYVLLLKNYFKDADEYQELINDARNIIKKWGNLQRKSWLSGKKVIAFIGEFSAGKTSIVNRILSQDNPNSPKLPVSGKATTAIATYISYGETFLSNFTDLSGNLKKIDKLMFEKVNKDILSRVNVSSIINYFVMKYHNENLKGLSILDTPGFSSNDEDDQKRTLDVIHEADALFWVMDANSGDINRTSLKIIAENLDNLPLYIIINKADTKSPGELDSLEEHIRKTMENAKIQVSGYLKFSQGHNLEELMNVIKRLPELRTNINIGSICWILHSFLGVVNDQIKELKHDIRKDEDGLISLKEGIDETLSEQQESVRRIASLPQYNSRWFSQDDYRMDQEEYQELNDLCNVVDQCGDSLEILIGVLQDNQESYLDLKSLYSELQEKKSAILKVYNNLFSAIKNLNLDLYNDINFTIKELEEEQKRGHNNGRKKKSKPFEPKDSVSDEEQNEEQFSSNEKRYTESVDNEILDWMDRAENLMNNGAKDEAFFWYKKAARAGSREAKKICKSNHIKY